MVELFNLNLLKINHMKSALVIAACFVSAAAIAQTAKPFTLKGNIKNFEAEKVYLTYRSNGATVSDSIVPASGTYSFKGTLVEPVRAQLTAKPASVNGNPVELSRKNVASIFLSPANMVATSIDSFSNITVKGSIAQDEYAKVEKDLKPFNEKSRQLNDQYNEFDKAKDEAGKNRIIAEFNKLSKESKEVYSNYVKANPNSSIALYLINQYAGYDINADEVDPLFNSLPASAKALPSYKDLDDRLAIARKIGIGKAAMDFTQNDTLGNPVSLASFKGKYVLVDFWASWCGPCRKENPNVVTAYNKYQDKGFTVLGVSLDQPGAQARWIKAIHDDKLTWTHVSDLKFWNNDVAKLYGVRAIPFNLLLDKEGKIVAKNIRGEELQTKLAEIIQ